MLIIVSMGLVVGGAYIIVCFTNEVQYYMYIVYNAQLKVNYGTTLCMFIHKYLLSTCT